MNSQNSPQSHAGTTQSTSGNQSNLGTGQPPKAAVIRLKRPLAGTDRDVRLDAAEPQKVRAPHMRTDQLKSYVSWLQQQPVVGIRKGASSKVSREKQSTQLPQVTLASLPAAPPAAHQPNVTTTNAPTANVSAPTTPTATRESSQTAENSTQQRQRVDHAHAAAGSHHAAPNPNVSASDFKFEADLERILNKLDMSDMLMSSRAAAVPPTTQPTQTIEAGLSKLSAADSDRIIQTISQAIASVLNDKTQPQTQHQHQPHPQPQPHISLAPPKSIDSNSANRSTNRSTSTISGPALASAPTETAQNVKIVLPSTNDRATVGPAVDSDIATPQSNPSPAVNTESAPLAEVDIPTSIAAWDVEDFRWPKITNHMISTGSEAINRLTHSVFELLDADQRRLVVTSPGRGEGTTSIAMSIARWTAANGGRVLLVDADLASPGLSLHVGLGPNISWVNAISNSLDPAEVIIRSQNSPICIMPLAPIVTRVTWPRYLYDQLSHLIQQVESSFDLVVFDCGPASQLMSELSQSRLLVDAGLIVHHGLAPGSFLQTQSLLRAFGMNRFTVAQNAVQQAAANVA